MAQKPISKSGKDKRPIRPGVYDRMREAGYITIQDYADMTGLTYSQAAVAVGRHREITRKVEGIIFIDRSRLGELER